MSLKKKIKNILDDSFMERTYPETINKIIETIKESMPTVRNGAGTYPLGWNDYRTEVIKRLEE